MKNRSMIMLCGGTVAIALTCIGCGPKAKDGAAAASAAKLKAVNVSVEEVRPTGYTESLQLTGAVKAYDDIMVSPEEGGIVKQWKFAKGQFVRKGQVIVELKDDVAKPSYEAAAAQYNAAQLSFEKQQKVFDEQAVSELQFKSSQFARDGAKAQSDLMYARLQRTHIKSPIDGILDDRTIDEGEFAPPMSPIAHIVNLSSVKLMVNVPERYAGTVTIGSVARFSVLAYPGEMYTGRITFISASVSTDNRTFPVEAVIRNPGSRLKPEMIAKVEILRSSSRDALMVDESVVLQLDRNKRVVYVEKDGKVQERLVQVGGREKNRIAIVSGVRPGERVVISGQQGLTDGQSVSVGGGK